MDGLTVVLEKHSTCGRVAAMLVLQLTSPAHLPPTIHPTQPCVIVPAMNRRFQATLHPDDTYVFWCSVAGPVAWKRYLRRPAAWLALNAVMGVGGVVLGLVLAVWR